MKPVYLKTDETRLAGAERDIRFLKRRGLIPDPHPDYDPGGDGTTAVMSYLYATLPRTSALVSLGGSNYGPDWDNATVDTGGDMTGVAISTSEIDLPDGSFLLWYGGWAGVGGYPYFVGTGVSVHQHGRLLQHESGSPGGGVGLAMGSDVRFTTAAQTVGTFWQSGSSPTSDAAATLLIVRFE